MKFFLIAAFSTCLAACVPMDGQKPPSITMVQRDPSYVHLLQINDLNNGALAYQAHCAPGEKINPQFLSNMKYVSDKLFDESRMALKISPDKALDQIVKRRDYLFTVLGQMYKNNGGCDFTEARQAAHHYQFFSHFTTRQIDGLIRDGLEEKKAPNPNIV